MVKVSTLDKRGEKTSRELHVDTEEFHLWFAKDGHR